MVRSGAIGIDANANLTVKNVDEINKTLYYDLTPVNKLLNSTLKTEIIRDAENIVNASSATLLNNPL